MTEETTTGAPDSSERAMEMQVRDALANDLKDWRWIAEKYDETEIRRIASYVILGLKERGYRVIVPPKE